MGKSSSTELPGGETRATVLERAVTNAVEGATTGDGGAAAATGPVLRVDQRSFASSDVGLTVVDGRPRSITARPTATYAWAGLDCAPAEVGATLLATLPAEGGGFDPVATEVLPLDASDGEGDARLDFESAYCVLANTTMAPVDLSLLGSGEASRERVVRLRLLVDLLDEDGLPMEGDAVTADWVVTVERDGGSATFLDR